MKRVNLLASGAAIFFLTACTTPKDVAYVQDIVPGTIITAQHALDIKVRPEDKLQIVVNTQDASLSSLFNLSSNTNRNIGSGNGTTTVGNQSNSGNQIVFYTVDPQGDIDFPVLGKLHIAGMTRTEVAEFIRKKLIKEDLVKDPIVTVEFGNTGISVLGEVSSPGRKEFNRDRLSIIEAIAIAGDLSVNGRRDNVLVLRDLGNGKQEAYRVDLTDAASLVNSPVYYLQQNDIIYVEPNDKRKRETTPNGNTPYTPSFWVSLGSVALTVATFIITLVRK